MKNNGNKNYKFQSILEFLIIAGIVLLLNLVLADHFFRLDFSKEKRYSLSDASKKMAAKVDAAMYFKVYLEGEFPAGFKRLGKSVKEILDEYRVYSNNNIQYEFIDPFAGADAKKHSDIIQELGAKGLQPTNVQVNKEDEFAQKIIVPGALVYFHGKELSINFLKNQFGQNPEEVINSSIELLEYEISNLLRKALLNKSKKIAIIDDHGELGRWDIAEAQAMLGDFYQVERLPLSIQVPEKLNEYAGIIIAKPRFEFPGFDKFKIDQYIMNGGKVLWLLESQHAEMDSLRSGNLFVTTTYPTKLEDMLFRYGVRLNPGIVQDLQCNAIPVLSGMRDGVPQQKLLPWPYFPVAAPIIDHPIVKGIDPVWFQFSASIDTLANKQIKKTILLQSSPYSRIISAPARVDLNVSRLDLQPEMFRRKSNGNFPLAVLLEGSFNSIFEYRFDAQKNPGIAFKNKVENNKMIVIADGDVIRNQYKQSTGEVFPLGFDRYTNEQFGNKKFIQNCIDYLCDDSGIIEIRAKEITLRLLDKGKIKKEKMYWTLLNTCLPLLFILLFGMCNHYIRKRKYTHI